MIRRKLPALAAAALLLAGAVLTAQNGFSGATRLPDPGPTPAATSAAPTPEAITVKDWHETGLVRGGGAGGTTNPPVSVTQP
jgi:hypothetical protein